MEMDFTNFMDLPLILHLADTSYIASPWTTEFLFIIPYLWISLRNSCQSTEYSYKKERKGKILLCLLMELALLWESKDFSPENKLLCQTLLQTGGRSTSILSLITKFSTFWKTHPIARSINSCGHVTVRTTDEELVLQGKLWSNIFSKQN